MLAANETVVWHPPHIKHGGFGDWLSNNVDGRSRASATGAHRCRCGAAAPGTPHVIGSFAELERLSGTPLADHHRPYVDEVEFPCPHAAGGGAPCGEPMRRVPEVIDVWFDSGAMPFAQHHIPFSGEGEEEAFSGEGEEEGEEQEQGHVDGVDSLATQAERFTADPARFPADFICEALDQTRGWFYSLLAVSTLLFDTAPYRNVVCLGLILDGEGQRRCPSRAATPWSPDR